MISNKSNIIAMTGAVILFAGLVLQFFRLEYAPYIYMVGAVCFSYVQVMHGGKATNVVLRRLYRQQQIGAILLVITGVIMLLFHRNEWIVCLSIAAFLELYTSFRIPQEEEKQK